MFGRRRRRRGMGISGFLLIIALLYFTGAGKWLWDRMLQIEGQCYTMLVQMGTTAGSSVCGTIGGGIMRIDRFFSDTGGNISSSVDGVRMQFAGYGDLDSAVGELQLTSALARLGSSKDELAQKMRVGPESLNMGDQVRRAVDSFTVGQRFLNSDGSGSHHAIPWLQEGAQVPGYGVLSQLSLGDLYSRGTVVGQDPAAAIGYYSQAHQSIGMLQQSNTPEANQMLKALPASPDVVRSQLAKIVAELQKMQKR